MTYKNGSWTEGEPEPEEEDGGWDAVGKNPTGRKTRSSAGKRRRRLRKLFGDTQWDDKK